MRRILLKTDQRNQVIRQYNEAVEKGKKNQHVVPYGKKWAVTDLISSKADYITSSPQDALTYAETRATRGTAVFLHGEDGLIVSRKDF